MIEPKTGENVIPEDAKKEDVRARVYIQVREGALNVLSDSTIQIAPDYSVPNEDAGTITHSADTGTIVEAVFKAVDGLVMEIMQSTEVPEEWDKWLMDRTRYSIDKAQWELAQEKKKAASE